ncbi:MAG: argininosuccinate lyase [Candidatus Binatia bacterium]|nr:MAG: argininosuccinate lyase [Candidatus Binatia bacterium]
MPSGKAWSGRFAERTRPEVELFTSSLAVDRRLYRYDIRGSEAHCRALARAGILRKGEEARILGALREIEAEIDSGRFAWRPEDEDIHMAVERRLIEKLGPLGGKLHTGRSRNDQVVLDLFLYLRDETEAIGAELRALEAALARQARAHVDTVLPLYTHLQPAQPVLLAHHLLAYVEMLERDRLRFADCRRRLDVLPLGAGAGAGTGFGLDLRFLGRLLGFRRVTANSIDAVASRDVPVEFLSAAAIAGMHLSRLAEELVLWASPEFGFVELPDAFATGSSMMPQKKNPDVAELVRGRTGRLYGNLLALLTVLKGLPLAYNRDLQEDKEPLFSSADTLRASLGILAAMVPHLKFRPERMREAALEGFTLATELADYLVLKGVPFREAHAVVGRLVRYCLEHGRGLETLELEELRRFSPKFDRDVQAWLTLEHAVGRRKAPGGTAKRNVLRRLARLGL